MLASRESPPASKRLFGLLSSCLFLLTLHLLVNAITLIQLTSGQLYDYEASIESIDALDERICGLRAYNGLSEGDSTAPDSIEDLYPFSGQHNLDGESLTGSGGVQGRGYGKANGGNEKRISAGWNAMPGEFPWNVVIRVYFSEEFSILCQGSIIHHNLILTAAHCVRDIKSLARPIEMTVQAGLTKPGHGERPQRAFGELSCVVANYGGYNSRPRQDLAVVRLNSSLQYNQMVRPICMRLDGPVSVEDCLVSGFGHVEFGSQRPPVEPQQLQAISQVPCDWSTEGSENTEPNELCMVSGDLVRYPGSTCAGDSGSGLACREASSAGERFFVAGTLSHGLNVCGPGQPVGSIYTDLYKQRHDLLQILEQCLAAPY